MLCKHASKRPVDIKKYNQQIQLNGYLAHPFFTQKAFPVYHFMIFAHRRYIPLGRSAPCKKGEFNQHLFRVINQSHCRAHIQLRTRVNIRNARYVAFNSKNMNKKNYYIFFCLCTLPTVELPFYYLI